jgi:hypothetical protein
VTTLVIKGIHKRVLDFFFLFAYTKKRNRGGEETVNEFETRVEKRNDAVDSAVGFIVSFGFFATLFIIATVIKVVGS